MAYAFLSFFSLTTNHGTTDTVSSCSMLPRAKHGVVDTNLNVYGTSNLRVADLSVVPLQVAAHTQCECRSITMCGRVRLELGLIGYGGSDSVGVCDWGSRYVYVLISWDCEG